jgi:type VI secretion system secreted protein Hcp
MAYEAYVTVEATKQGKFKGESIRDKHKDKVAMIDFSYEVISPRDLATGQPSGKRQHKPIVVTKEAGASSPLALAACCSNEILKSVLFEFFKSGKDGKEYCYQTIKLTNATLCSFKQYTGQAGGAKHEEGYDTHELEEWQFTFQKIEITNNDGKTSAFDDWAQAG